MVRPQAQERIVTCQSCTTMERDISLILKEDMRRTDEINAPFNPVTGYHSIGDRYELCIPDFSIPRQMIPIEMKGEPLVKLLEKYGTIKKYIKDYLEEDVTAEAIDKVTEAFIRVRIKYDFAFWGAILAYVKPKGGGADVLFRMNRPQRKLVTKFEELRMAGKPIRIIILKARQWGGSTCVQLYMAWLQLVHKVGLNSLIVGHQKDSSIEVEDMFKRLLLHYPVNLLHSISDRYPAGEPTFTGVGNSGNIHRVPQRNFKIKIGSAEKPNSAVGGDYNLVHLTEVGLWKRTEGKSPAEIVKSATSGILYTAYTMIVYESTARGVGNFFHTEYMAAKDGKSQFGTIFVSWFDIEQYTLPFDTDEEKERFAENLYKNRNNANAVSDREEDGRYLWSLWERGATLSAINWYIEERKKYVDHGGIASEFPSDDIEAFVNSGANVFDRYQVERLRPSCCAPSYVGDLYAKGDEGKDALTNITFKEDSQGLLWVWSKPETSTDIRVYNRYLVVVDIGGRGKKADWSVIVVFDRLMMAEDGVPSVVAQWYGHIDMDLLAWKSVQIAAWYDNALLVIESNTLETKDRNRDVEGDQSEFILNQVRDVYSNLYARKQSEEDIKEKKPVKYGFHTNVSTKPKIISTLVKVIREQLYTERDNRCIDEYLTYEKENGSYNAVIGAHDDLLMTRAIGLHICFYEMDMPKIVETAKRKTTTHKKVVSAATI